MPPAKTKRGRKAGEDLSQIPSKRKNVKCEPLTEVPDPPDHLGEFAKEYWHSLAEQLVKANLLTKLHVETFAILCECYQEYRTLNGWLNEDPERATIMTSSGYEVEAPQVRMRDKALANLNKLWLKFGLTPHSLAGMRKHGGISGGASRLPPVIEFAKSKYEAE
jgi:P27 family predicted phage terminase small subunit